MLVMIPTGLHDTITSSSVTEFEQCGNECELVSSCSTGRSYRAAAVLVVVTQSTILAETATGGVSSRAFASACRVPRTGCKRTSKRGHASYRVKASEEEEGTE